ncbi:hypothetical protein AAG570_006080 [Ranatra chinensis]|uniref:Uncharacterized protein n=1 Tax=Ranatra chinensis TaxID=642074 RepID=A0ABD0YKM8_9HEMI
MESFKKEEPKDDVVIQDNVDEPPQVLKEKSRSKKENKSKKLKRGADIEGVAGCDGNNPRRVEKRMYEGGKRKEGTKHVPTETENIPEHVARKQCDTKLEAFGLMMEDRRKDVFERAKLLPRPGISPKYHYIKQKTPAQNTIERPIPAPNIPAANRKPIMSKKRRDPQVAAMRLEGKARQEETVEGSKLKMRLGINPKYQYQYTA